MEPTTSTLHHHASAAAASAAGAGIRWNSPVLYLFGGMAAVLLLIAMALVILACTKDKGPQDKEKDAAGKASAVVDDGPRFVVIMAGAHRPAFLARPVPKPEPEPEPVAVAISLPIGDEQV